jgi:hypothetical protein
VYMADLLTHHTTRNLSLREFEWKRVDRDRANPHYNETGLSAQTTGYD